MLENMARSAQAGSTARRGDVHDASPHRVYFYQGDSVLDALTSFVGEGLDVGERVLVVATEQRVADPPRRTGEPWSRSRRRWAARVDLLGRALAPGDLPLRGPA